MNKIYVLHENNAWVEPLRAALSDLGFPYEEWHLDAGVVRIDRGPPEGVFYNRMSASSHTRGHRYAPELAHLVLNWLECHGRRVVNNSRALYLEISKVAQYTALMRHGIRTPRTIAAVGHDAVLDAARELGDGPYLLKPNRGGKGLGVQLFASIDAIAAYLRRSGIDQPIDGVWLVQEYIRSAQPYITRCEFVGGRFLYAVRVDTSGGFELCPADECSIDDAYCPATAPVSSKFTVVDTMNDHPIVSRYEAFLRENGIEIAGIEFIMDEAGEIFTYDVNTNTNYNSGAELAAGIEWTGMKAIARFLGSELSKPHSLH